MPISINPDFKGATRKLMGGKTKQRSQLCLVGTEDGRLVPPEFDVLRACAVDSSTESAYLLDAGNQFRNRDDGKWYQLIGERSTLPICLLRETPVTDLKKLIEEIFKESKEATKDRKYREAKEGKNWNRFTWLVAMIVCTAMVLVFLRGC